jgi:hypothetical protein
MPLWSFEGVRLALHLTIFGGHSDGGTPLPIPNREVKPASADGTRRATSRESRSPPNFQGPFVGPFFWSSRSAQAFRPLRIELAQSSYALLDARMGEKEPGETALLKRIHDVEGLRRRVPNERHELAGLFETR